MRHLLLAAALLAVGACSNGSTDRPAADGARTASATAHGHVVPKSASHAVRGPLPPLRTGGVATLADHGSLVAYAKKPAPGNGSYTWHPVAVSEAHAIAAIARGELDLTAPDGSPIHLKYDRHIEHPDGNWTWIGRPDGATAGNEAIITFGPEAVFGTIPSRDGVPLRLTTIQGRTWMMATDPEAEKQLANTERRETDGLLPPSITRRAAAAGTSTATRTTAAAPSTAAASAANTVDVLVGYTNEMATRFGGQSGANTRITFLVDVTNQAFFASQIDAAVRLVGTMQVGYTETNSNAQALYNLTGVNCTEQSDGSLDCNDGTVPSSLAPLVNARTQFGADVVVLVRTFRNVEQLGCGIAWLLGGGQSSITQSDSDFAFAVVSDSNGDGLNSIPSNNRVCRDEAFAHELGHIMGAQHDRETAAGDDGQLTSDEYGRFAYSFGYRGGPANVYTVMAYGAAGQGKVRLFSNPNVACSPSPNVPAAPCGIADQADNARALRQTLPIIASFRAAARPALRARNDINGDGRSEIVMWNASLGYLASWNMDGATYNGASNYFIGTGYVPATLGRSTLSGRSDALFKRPADLQLVSFRSTGTSLVPFNVGGYDPAWNVIGQGDINGDGKDDIFWREPNAGYFAYWYMDGSVYQGGQSYSPPAVYAIAAIDDFNADGRMDIVWNDAASRYMSIWVSVGSGFSVAQIGQYGTDWRLIGAADVTGDGKADLLWRNTANTFVSWWQMDGAVYQGAGSQPTPTDVQLAALGDYNGDGIADLLWERAADRTLTMWLGQSGYFYGALVGARGADWALVR